jgi:hypothetical protein
MDQIWTVTMTEPDVSVIKEGASRLLKYLLTTLSAKNPGHPKRAISGFWVLVKDSDHFLP